MHRLTACGPGCGYCGRCTDELDRGTGGIKPYPVILCDYCHEKRAYFGVSHLGVFCSPEHADKASEQHATAMDRVRRG